MVHLAPSALAAMVLCAVVSTLEAQRAWVIL